MSTMKKIFTLLAFLFIFTNIWSQGTSCSTPLTITSGACLNNQSFPGSANMAGLCVGGNNPSIWIMFTAGNCSQFTITPNFSLGSGEIGYAIRTTACSAVSGSVGCIGNIVSGEPFTISSINSTGTQLLTPGTQYILQIWGGVGSNTFNICYNSRTPEQPSNECGGALNLGLSTQSFFNGGDCSFSGSYDDATTTDQASSTMCAGSLENTQWIQFSPQAGASSFQVIGSGIHCTGGGCGFQFGIFSGDCSSLTSEGCYGNKSCSGGQPTAGPTNAAGGLVNIAWSNLSTTSFTATFTPISGSTFLGTETFYLVMDGNADADCNYDLTGINVNDPLLSFDLLNFSSEIINNKIKLNWSSLETNNVDKFYIERSFNGIDFTKIGEIYNNDEFTWEFYDNIITNLIYYRLAWDDYSSTHYSNIIAVTTNIDFEQDISPNPFNEFITIRKKDDNNSFCQVLVIDMTGQIKIKHKLQFEGLNKIEIDTRELSTGFYTVIVNREGYIKSFKMTK